MKLYIFLCNSFASCYKIIVLGHPLHKIDSLLVNNQLTTNQT